MTKISECTLTSKGQTTIPVEIRSLLNLKPGDKLRFVSRDGKVWVEAKTRRAVDMAGLFHDPARRPMSSDELDALIAASVTLPDPDAP